MAAEGLKAVEGEERSPLKRWEEHCFIDSGPLSNLNLKLKSIDPATCRSLPRDDFKASLGIYQLATIKSRSRVKCMSNTTWRKRSKLPHTLKSRGNEARCMDFSQLRDLSPWSGCLELDVLHRGNASIVQPFHGPRVAIGASMVVAHQVDIWIGPQCGEGCEASTAGLRT